MNFFLRKLSLVNFKGIRQQEFNFGPVTNISGANATGKTTVYDAFLWLLFGKDSTDRKDFEIKTLGPDNQPFHRLDHEVTGYCEVDGEEVILKRTLREKWVQKKGEKERIFSGHETAYFWNDVPLKESEYKLKIAAILDESVFKLITNTHYFNSLPWQE